jgi:hypothetical protein
VFSFPFILLASCATALTLLILFIPVLVIANWRRGKPLLPRNPDGAPVWRSLPLIPNALLMALIPPRTGLLSRLARLVARNW